ncbi:MAG: methyltransferase domain-containing protein [Nitrospirota bacterium]
MTETMIKNHFDKIAKYYDNALPSHVEEHYYLKRINLLTNLMEKGRVLDVCSGTGRISEGLIERGFNVTSLDLSINMLLTRKNVRNYQPVNGISLALPFKANIFDMVISIASFHHIAEKEKIKNTLFEMQRVTKKGGCIILWDHNPLNPYWKFIMKKVPQDIGQERLIGTGELVAPFPPKEYSYKIFRKGFIPDFAPKSLMKLFKVIEKLVESIPLVNYFAAHNVIIIKKL